MNTKRTVLAISLLIVILMVYAAVAKLLDFDNFKAGLEESPMIAPFYRILVWAVPFTELAIAVLLLVPAWRLIGFYASLGLMSLFTIYIIVMLSFFDDIPCSCGGILENMTWTVHVFFNAIFVLLSAIGIVLEKKGRHSIVPGQPSAEQPSV